MRRWLTVILLALGVIIAYVDRTTISARFRLNYSFNPDLTIEGYAEPFAASGEYYDFGELLAPRSRDLKIYGTGGTTINRQSDGSNLIGDGAARDLE